MLQIARGEAHVLAVYDVGSHRRQVSVHDPVSGFGESGARAVGGPALPGKIVDHGGAGERLALPPRKHRTALGPDQAGGIVHGDGGIGRQIHPLGALPEEARARLRISVEYDLPVRPELEPGPLVLAGLIPGKRQQRVED